MKCEDRRTSGHATAQDISHWFHCGGPG